MSNAAIFLVALVAWLVVVLLIARVMRINGRETETQQAVDSMRAALESDERLDELRTYTRPHIKAGTAWGKEL